jgi:hypothetical protein
MKKTTTNIALLLSFFFLLHTTIVAQNFERFYQGSFGLVLSKESNNIRLQTCTDSTKKDLTLNANGDVLNTVAYFRKSCTSSFGKINGVNSIIQLSDSSFLETRQGDFFSVPLSVTLYKKDGTVKLRKEIANNGKFTGVAPFGNGGFIMTFNIPGTPPSNGIPSIDSSSVGYIIFNSSGDERFRKVVNRWIDPSPFSRVIVSDNQSDIYILQGTDGVCGSFRLHKIVNNNIAWTTLVDLGGCYDSKLESFAENKVGDKLALVFYSSASRQTARFFLVNNINGQIVVNNLVESSVLPEGQQVAFGKFNDIYFTHERFEAGDLGRPLRYFLQLSRRDSLGNLLAQKRLFESEPSSFSVRVKDMLVTDDGNLYITGSRYESAANNGIWLLKETMGLNLPYCESKAAAPWQEWISNVKLNTIDNTSGKFRDYATYGYSNFLDKTTTLVKGQTYPLSITPSVSWSGRLANLNGSVWIDYNRNNIFETTERVLFGSQNNPYNTVLQIPSTALLGETRMRVSLKSSSPNSSISPCETIQDGEVEDYTVNIVEATGPDIAVSITATPQVATPYSTVKLNVSAKNIGNANFTNVKISVPFPRDRSVTGGNAIASTGVWAEWCGGNRQCFEWTIPSLAVGAEANLELPIYVFAINPSFNITASLQSSIPDDTNIKNNTSTVTIGNGSGNLLQSNSGFLNTTLSNAISVYPNPNNGNFAINIDNPTDESVASFDFFNAIGQIVHSEKRTIKKGFNQPSFNLSDKEQGTYVVKIQFKDTIKALRLLKF